MKSWVVSRTLEKHNASIFSVDRDGVVPLETGIPSQSPPCHSSECQSMKPFPPWLVIMRLWYCVVQKVVSEVSVKK
jgi:hypothetical protein